MRWVNSVHFYTMRLVHIIVSDFNLNNILAEGGGQIEGYSGQNKAQNFTKIHVKTKIFIFLPLKLRFLSFLV